MLFCRLLIICISCFVIDALTGRPDLVQTAITAGPSSCCLLITFKKCTILFDCGLELVASDGIHCRLPSAHQLNLDAVDVILISNYFNISGLPYLAEKLGFRGRIYATLPTVQFGRVLLTDMMDAPLTAESTLEKAGIFTSANIESALSRVRVCSFDQRISLYSGIEAIPVSSGVCTGGANWIIRTPFEKICIMSNTSNTVNSHPAMSRHYHAQSPDLESLRNADALIVSPTAFQPKLQNTDYSVQLKVFCDILFEITQRNGGHVIVPCRPSVQLLDLLGLVSIYFSSSTDSFGMSAKVHQPKLMLVYPEAKTLCETADISTEWLPTERQDRSNQPAEPFLTSELMQSGNVKIFSSIHEASFRSSLSGALSSTAIGSTATVCPLIIFVGHSSMQHGQVTHLIEFFKKDPRCGVVSIDPDFSAEFKALTRPFRTDETKINFYESYLDARLDAQSAAQMIQVELTPRRLIVPQPFAEVLSDKFILAKQAMMETIFPYKANDMYSIKLNRQFERAEMDHRIASNLRPRPLGSIDGMDSTSITSVLAKLVKRDGKMKLAPVASSSGATRAGTRYLWGQLNTQSVATAFCSAFESQGYTCQVAVDSAATLVVLHSNSVPVASVTLTPTRTLIDSADSTLRRKLALFLGQHTL